MNPVPMAASNPLLGICARPALTGSGLAAEGAHDVSEAYGAARCRQHSLVAAKWSLHGIYHAHHSRPVSVAESSIGPLLSNQYPPLDTVSGALRMGFSFLERDLRPLICI